MALSAPLSSHRVLLPLLIGAFLLSGCDLFGADDNEASPLETTGVFVANGGNFSDQNGTITVYDPETMDAATPSDLQLNAFVHSIDLHNGRLYAQLNTGFNAGRVTILDPDTYASTAQSDSLGATRYVAFADSDTSRAYVSTLRGTVQPFTPTTGDFTGPRVNVGASAGDLLATQEKVFTTIPDTSLALADTVTNNGSTLAVFDADAPTSVRSIPLGCDGPSAVAQDGEDELVVVCTGRTTYNSDFSEVVRRTPGSIVFVDPSTESVVNRIQLETQVGTLTGTQLAHYDDASELLHAVSSVTREIVRVDTDANALVGRIDVPADSSLTGIAAAAYDGTSQRLYVARGDVQRPFQASGTMVVLGSSRSIVDEVRIGPAPSHLLIRRESR